MSTSVSTPPNRPDDTPDEKSANGSKPRRDRTVKRVVTGFMSLILIGVVFLVIRTQGHVSGIEFAPTHFQQRSFRFFEIPLLRIQITPIHRSSQTPTTANYLRLNSLIQTPTGTPTTWHLVSLSRGLTGYSPADAELLTSQLSLEIGGDEYWRKWSIDHPQHAKVFWPVVQQLALRELYILLPPLFELAQLDQSPEDLKSGIDGRLRTEYASLVRDLRSVDRDELAEQILNEAIGDFPEDPELQSLRSKHD